MLPFRLLIDGQLESGDAELDVVNPATEEVIARCPRASMAQLEAAVAAAKRAFPAWRDLTLLARRACLDEMAERLDANAEELARLLTLEIGKPLADARIEVAATAAFIRYFAALETTPRMIDAGGGRTAELQRRPLGVVAAIIPWNLPLMIVGFKLPPALLTGNCVVLKPAPTAPLAVLRFAEIIADVVPAGVFNTIADANDLGDHMSAHPDIRKISFTGSTRTGERIMASAATTLKRLTLELGGNDAAIVLDDADPDAVAEPLFNAAFANSGQVCLAVKRLYVHSTIYDRICAKLAQLADQCEVGDGLEQGVTLGPVQNAAQFERVMQLIETSRRSGRVIAGGERARATGYFIRPTIVRDIEEGSPLVDEEQFGPVLPVIRFDDPEDALRRANASSFGLGGSIWSSDEKRAYDLASRMDAGTVWVNTHMSMTPNVPFAGAKSSGIGVEFGEEGLAEFTQLHVVNMAR